jgi:hypothetical protein
LDLLRVEGEKNTQTLTLTQEEKGLVIIERKLVYLYIKRVGCVYSNDQYSMHSMYIACPKQTATQHAQHVHSMHTAAAQHAHSSMHTACT